MLAVDTNILVRLITQDDKKQAAFLEKFLANKHLYVPKTVLLELEWVLRYTYGFARGELIEIYTRLLDSQDVTVENSNTVEMAFDYYKHGLDFADALHLASSEETKSFITLDKRFIHKAKKLSLLKVRAAYSTN